LHSTVSPTWAAFRKFDPAKTVERRQFMVEISRRVVIQGSGAVGAMILPVDELCAHTSAT
ncbi:MAG TPA: hypothetical protein VNZ53_49040, partial [Steroidobacteraceae bacterium]|nr:hypothetical protein [Steroidobacteraceae bacterium]